MLAGMLIAIISYRTIYSKMYDAGSTTSKQEVVARATFQVSTKEDLKNKGDSIRSTVVTKQFSDGTTYKETKTESVFADFAKVTNAKPRSLVSAVLHFSTKNLLNEKRLDSWQCALL